MGLIGTWSSLLGTLRWKRDVITCRLFGNPVSQPTLVPPAPPCSIIIRLFFVSKSDTHSNLTGIAMVKVLKAVWIRFTGLATFLKSFGFYYNSTCLSKFSRV